MTAFVPSLALVARVRDGEIRAIARLLSRAEAGDDECRPALEEIFRHAGRAHVVGITGVPGCGKSTLVARLAAEIRATGRRVAKAPCLSVAPRGKNRRTRSIAATRTGAASWAMNPRNAGLGRNVSQEKMRM